MQIGVLYPQIELGGNPALVTMGLGLSSIDGHLDYPASVAAELNLS
jgi:hypothetical protein